MKKILGIITFIVVVVLAGCGNSVEVDLFVDDELFVSYESSLMKVIDLEIPEKEGMMFTGWMYEEEVVFDSIEVVGDMELHATWEDPRDVFTLVQHAEGPDAVIITGYTGDSIFMKIPAVIDGKMVLELGQLSFEGSPVEIMQLPMDIKINNTPFVDSSIRRVEYYGSYMNPKEKSIGKEKYDEIIEEYNDVCTIESGSVDSGTWTFSDGCPIIEVIEVTEITVSDATVYNYQIKIDLNIYEGDNHIQLGYSVFLGAHDLEEFRFPNAVNLFFDKMFSDCENLKNLEVNDENLYYSSEYGILYSKDKTQLRMFPNGAIDQEFSVPNEVTYIYSTAFNYVENLEILNIHSDYNGDLNIYGGKSLQAIQVANGNEKYNSIDGVLFEGDTLLKYPPSKIDTNYTIPDGITEIQFSAFRYNKHLEQIDLADDLISIGGYAFAESESLEVIDLPGSVEMIGLDALHLSSIETVIVRRDVETYGSITQLDMRIRGDFDFELQRIYVPDSSFNEYRFINSPWEFYVGMFRRLSELE